MAATRVVGPRGSGGPSLSSKEAAAQGSAAEGRSHGAQDNSDEYVRSLLDLTSPAAWYPAARMLRRRVVAHLGPTNSGQVRCMVVCVHHTATRGGGALHVLHSCLARLQCCSVTFF